AQILQPFLRANVFKDLKPVELGHHQVQHHQVRSIVVEIFHRREAVARDSDVKPLRQQFFAIRFDRESVVIDQQYLAHGLLRFAVSRASRLVPCVYHHATTEDSGNCLRSKCVTAFTASSIGNIGLEMRSSPPLSTLWIRLSKSLWLVTKMMGAFR